MSTILEEAAKVTAGDRNHHYGAPIDNHGATAAMWQAYLDRIGPRDLEPEDVCNLMILQKVSRDANRPKDDNDVDIVGYARNKEMIREEREIRNKQDLPQYHETRVVDTGEAGELHRDALEKLKDQQHETRIL